MLMRPICLCTCRVSCCSFLGPAAGRPTCIAVSLVRLRDMEPAHTACPWCRHPLTIRVHNVLFLVDKQNLVAGASPQWPPPGKLRGGLFLARDVDRSSEPPAGTAAEPEIPECIEPVVAPSGSSGRAAVAAGAGDLNPPTGPLEGPAPGADSCPAGRKRPFSKIG